MKSRDKTTTAIMSNGLKLILAAVLLLPLVLEAEFHTNPSDNNIVIAADDSTENYFSAVPVYRGGGVLDGFAGVCVRDNLRLVFQRLYLDSTTRFGSAGEQIGINLPSDGSLRNIKVIPSAGNRSFVFFEHNITTTQEDNWNIYAFIVDDEGVIVPLINADGGSGPLDPNLAPIFDADSDQINFKAIPDGEGGAYIVCEDYRDASQVYLQRVTNNLDKLFGDEGVLIDFGGDQVISPNIITAHDGVFITAERFSNDDWDIVCEFRTRNGTIPQGGEYVWGNGGIILSNTDLTDDITDRDHVAIYDDFSGEVVAVYVREESPDNKLYARRINQFGVIVWDQTPNGLQISDASGAQVEPSLASAPGGQTVVTWSNRQNYNPDDGYFIMLQLFSQGGDPQLSENGNTNGIQLGYDASIMSDNRNSIVTVDSTSSIDLFILIVWEHNFDGDKNIECLAIAVEDGNPTGEPIRIWEDDPLVISDGPGEQLPIQVEKIGGWKTLVFIQDNRDTGDIKVCKINDSRLIGDPPKAPSNFRSTSVQSSRVTMTWRDNSEVEDEFLLERSASQNFSPKTTFNIPANIITYTDNTVQPSTRYYYRIKARNIVGESSYASTVPGPGTYIAVDTPAVTPPPTCTINAPSDLNAVFVEGSGVLLTWNDNSNNENEFRLYGRKLVGGIPVFFLITTFPANTTQALLSESSIEEYLIEQVYTFGVTAYSQLCGESSMVSVTLLAQPNVPSPSPGILIPDPTEPPTQGSPAPESGSSTSTSSRQRGILCYITTQATSNPASKLVTFLSKHRDILLKHNIIGQYTGLVYAKTAPKPASRIANSLQLLFFIGSIPFLALIFIKILTKTK
ncbi:MAG: fibronectin type III domain-containing protein [Planctomycetes bacterium]|nr:fibronectin type III domain-containing protein [Planctomycetota bacterium]